MAINRVAISFLVKEKLFQWLENDCYAMKAECVAVWLRGKLRTRISSEMKPSTMVDKNESNSVTKPSDTYEKGQRKHEVEREGRIRPAKVGEQKETA